MIYDRSDLKLKILDQGDISKCTWLLQQPALEIALQYNFYCMDEIPHISFEVCVFFRKFFCEIAGGKRAGKYLLLHMWCLPTCQKSIGIDDMKLNYSEYSNRLCQNIAYFVCKKSRESSEWFQQTQAVHLVFWRVFWINYKRTLYDCKTQV